jgi:hypothetical protein
MGLGLLVGCGGEPTPTTDLAPNPVVREAVENPATPKIQTRFGYDERGRLLVADGLVHGFEVPMGLSKPSARHGFIDFDIAAPMNRLKEFYLGREAGSGARFTERRYMLDEGKTGFEIWHTAESLKRLGLPVRFKRAHIFVTNHFNRTQRLRIHIPKDSSNDLAEPFVPDITAETRDRLRKRTVAAISAKSRGASGNAGASNGSGSRGENGGSSSGGSSGGSSGSSSASGSAGSDPAEIQEDTPGFPQAPPGATTANLRDPGGRSTTETISREAQRAAEKTRERYGPYPPNRRNDARPLVRAWLLKNPGKVFLD